MKALGLTVFLALISLDCSALDSEQLDTYLKLLKMGCSVDTQTELNISADGKLVILKKASIGGISFDLNKSEKLNILNALKDETLKGDQASEQRKCQQHYLDKIFALMTPVGTSSTKEQLTKAGGGYLFELSSCNKQDRNNVVCELHITSSYYDRELMLKPIMYDNFNNEYFPSKVSIANFHDNGRYARAKMIADTRAGSVILFSNVNTQASRISLLRLIDGVEYRDIPITSGGK
ncbi:MAG: hypothetical protein P8166_15450 [Candidatus Thiodiazotropha sp.]